MENQPTQAQVAAPELDIFALGEIVRSTQKLNEWALRQQGNEIAEGLITRRIGEISLLVRDNPERLAVDMTKPPHKRTEHDKERAHLIAGAIDEEMTYLAQVDRRRAQRGIPSDRPNPFMHRKAVFQKHWWTRIAQHQYDENPLSADPNTIKSLENYIGRPIIARLFGRRHF